MALSKTAAAQYHYLTEKLEALRRQHPGLADKGLDYWLSVIAIRAQFFPFSHEPFTEAQIRTMVVDGTGDGGVDAILTEPDSELSDMVFVQSKYYQSIDVNTIKDAIQKMVRFHKDMERGAFEQCHERVRARYLNVQSECEEGAKVKLVFVTSAPKGRIRDASIEKVLQDEGDTYELELLYLTDLIEKIQEVEDARECVELGEVRIDQAGNCLRYGDGALVVNVSAFSIKSLFTRYRNSLLGSNLRYYIRNKRIDDAIKTTIAETPEEFWYRNNGLTMVCDRFTMKGNTIELANFSIINGGQTSKILSDSPLVTKDHDFFVPCKIICAQGENKDEKQTFILHIAESTNSQKPIKSNEVKKNASEQKNFARALRQVGIFYETKRGEPIPKEYKAEDKHTKLDDVGKLYLAGLAQLPGSSRNKSSVFYDDEAYYDAFFEVGKPSTLSVQAQVIKELLEMATYFKNDFLERYVKRHASSGEENQAFARNAKTLCVAFAAFMGKYLQGDLRPEELKCIYQTHTTDDYIDGVRPIVTRLPHSGSLFPAQVRNDPKAKTNYLDEVFNFILMNGSECFEMKRNVDQSLSESNFLKRDLNYYEVLRTKRIRILTFLQDLQKKLDA